MLPALAAATTAIDALQALTASKKKAATTTGVTPKTANPFEVASTTTASATASTTTAATSTNSSYKLAPGTMATLLDAQSQPATEASEAKRADSLKRLMGMLDGDGSGGISKAEFENKLGAGGTNTANADKVFGKLDTDGDGSVSLKELAAAFTRPKDKDKTDDPSKAANSDPLLQALQGASSTTTTNSDGTTTTSMTYADGSKVSMTPAAGTSTSSYNVLEQMIQRQANAIATSSASSLSISA